MTRINVDLSELLAPIRQMREEIQKMNDALRQTIQLQSQMTASMRSGAIHSGGLKAERIEQLKELARKPNVVYQPSENIVDIHSKKTATAAPFAPDLVKPKIFTQQSAPEAPQKPIPSDFLLQQSKALSSQVGISSVFKDYEEKLTKARQKREEAKELGAELTALVSMRGASVYAIETGRKIAEAELMAAASPEKRGIFGRNIPAGIQLHRSYMGAQAQLFQGGVGITQAFASQAGLQNDLAAKREREEAIKQLSNSSNTTAKILLDVSKKIEQERAAASETLKRATDEYGKASEAGAKDLAKFARELDQAAKNFNKVNQKAEQFSTTLDDFIKKGGPGGGGGDGGGRGGFGGWWDKYGGRASAIAGGLATATATGFQLAGGYANIQAMGFQQTLNAMQAIPQNIAVAESLKFQKYMAVVAPTTGEQMLEAYGNLLTPGKKKFSYLGVGNRKARETEASKIFEEELKASEAERKATTRSAIGGGIGQAALSVGGIVGGAALMGTGVGILPGLGLMGAGIAGLIGAGKDAFTTITGAQTGIAGQKEGGVYDMPGAGMFFENAPQNAQTVKAMYQSGAIRQREQNERMLINAEKERFDARRLAMGLDENLAAMRMRTAATTMAGGAAVSGFEMFRGMPQARAEAIADRYAKLGYSIPEVGQIYNTYAGITGTTAGANRLLGLSRAGVGSVEQMASNVLGISAVSGKQGDTKQLENIFAKAFEAGLKGAPAIQRFSQAAMEMSTALKLQSATGAAGFLSQLTGAMAGKAGSPLMYMEEARSGLMGLAATTGATTGLMGTLKVMSGAGAGLSMGTGLGAASRSNVIQVQEAMQQLAAGGDYTKMTGLARRMVGAQMASGMSQTEAIGKARRALEGQMATQVAPFAAEYKRRTGKDFSAIQARAKEMLKKGDSEGLRNLMFQFEDETVGMAGLEAEGASMALLMTGAPPGDFKKGQKMLAQEKGKGAAKAAADFATVNYKRVLNKAAIDAAKGIDRDVSDEELKSTAAGMGIDTTKANWKQELGKAAGIDVAKGEKFTFAKLATAMSTYADKDTQRTSLSIIEAFGPTAVQQLADAVGGTPAGGVMTTTPGPSAPKTPQQIQQDKNRARTKSSIGSMMP